MGAGDRLASGGHKASWGPVEVSAEKWKSIFGEPEIGKKKRKSKARRKASNAATQPDADARKTAGKQ